HTPPEDFRAYSAVEKHCLAAREFIFDGLISQASSRSEEVFLHLPGQRHYNVTVNSKIGRSHLPELRPGLPVACGGA
ncbi:MAG: hypothetical protein DMG23_08265, partial [Acidobacteria bacterium]